MTITSADVLEVVDGAGAAVTQAVPGFFYKDGDVKVYRISETDGAKTEVLMVQGQDYTITKTKVNGVRPQHYTGSITTVSAIPATESIAVMVWPANEQLTDFSAIPHDPADFEKQHDLAALRDQSLLEVLKRTVRLPFTSNAQQPILPGPGKVLKMSDDGTRVVGAEPTFSGSAVDEWFDARDVISATKGAALSDGSIFVMAGLLYQSDSTVPLASSATNDLGVAGVKAFGIATVHHYGGACDGVADDTVALEAAVTHSPEVFIGPDDVVRITAEVTAPANRKVYGGGEIKVDQSPYVRGLFMDSNGRVEGITFRGNGVATARDAGLAGGQMGLAVASFNSNNVRVRNCQFYDFVATGLNTGPAIIMFSDGHNYEVSGCYFDDSNDGFVDIGAGYRAGDTLVTKNISYSNSDYFFGAASVGLGTKVGTSDVEATAHHVVTDNIAIKKRWEPAGAGRTLGRHGIIAHYDGGVSHITATGNVIGNVSRHGVYLRGNSTVPDQLCGPNTIANNRLLYCGSGDGSQYSSGIRVETTLPAIITGNYIENAGYFPDGTAGADPAYDIECVRGVRDLIVSNNTLIGAKNGSVYLAMTVSNREITNALVSQNTIKNAAFGIGISQGLATSEVTDIKVIDNHITLTGATGPASKAAGIATEATGGSPSGKFSLVVRGNTVAGSGKAADQIGIACLFGTSDLGASATIEGNVLRDLELGISSQRFFSLGTVNYLPHRRLGGVLKWDKNRFVSCGTAFDVPKAASTILAVIDGKNIYDDCDTVNVAATVTWSTAVEGRQIGRDTSGNILLEFRATAVPTAQQYYAGDRIVHPSPVFGNPVGWICTASGAPGTWLPIGAIKSPSVFTTSNVTTDRTFDADSTTVEEVADVLGTLITDLKGSGVIS